MKYFLAMLFCLSLNMGFAQNNASQKIKPDSRLEQVYSSDYLTRLQTANPFLIQRWNFYLDNAYFITDIPKGKETDYPTVKIDDLNNFNILLIEKEQKIHRDFKKRKYYQIKGTQKVLIYYSGEQFKDALNEHLGR